MPASVKKSKQNPALLNLPKDTPLDSLDNQDTFWLKYQKDWLADDSQIKFAEKGRREGFTYVQAYEDVRDCVTKKYFRKGRPLSVWFTSSDLSAAREYIVYCKEFASLFNSVAKDLGEVIIDEDKDVKAFGIEFKNGARIFALSSNPSQFRSKGGKVIIDEYAHHDNQKALWKAAFASAKIWGYPIRVISTHNGINSEFNKFIQKIKKGKLKYSLHTVPIQLAVEQGLADKCTGRKLTKKERETWLDEVHRDCSDEQVWLEEFCCIPLSEASALLSYDLIESCMVEPEELLLPLDKMQNDFCVGMDVARKKHLSVIAYGDKPIDTTYVRGIDEMLDVPFRKQEARLATYFSHAKFRRSCIDATGVGMELAENMQTDYGRLRVEDITFTERVKEELAYRLVHAFEDKLIRIPNDDKLKEDLHSVRKIVTSTNHIRFDVSQDNTDGHADRFWAIALLLHALAASGGASTVRAEDIRTSGVSSAGEVLKGYV